MSWKRRVLKSPEVPAAAGTAESFKPLRRERKIRRR